jgi:hypothetical protein
MVFPLQWRGRLLHIHIEADPRQIEIAVEGGGDLNLAIFEGPSCLAHTGRRYVSRGEQSGWGKWQEVCR